MEKIMPVKEDQIRRRDLSTPAEIRESQDIIKQLPWDSHFFGINIASINGSKLDKELLEEVFRLSAELGIELLYFECEVGDRESLRTAESGGFNLVDTRLRFIKTLERQVCSLRSVRKASIEDGDELGELASALYKDSRFYFDENISNEKCDQMYRQWIINSLHGFENIVLLMEEDRKPAGFISGKYNAHFGDIGLVGVGERFAGRGIGSALLQAIECEFAVKRMKYSRVLTQARNIPAQRLYAKNGYKVERLTHYYHRWFRR